MELLLIFQELTMKGMRLHTHNSYRIFSNSIECSMYTLLKVREVESEGSSYSKSTFFRQRICTGSHESKACLCMSNY